ncbi:DUF3040 domain-containing protein [Streptomyces sp. NPDC096048]|uniref:DUF3040 domain-containing protein n=1 Tax=Streptomyces sp. NPDC096048 TaxID=3366072 RepID=UPI003826D7BE
MSPEMNVGRILAQLERRLAKDDPSLAETMEALNQQFPDNPREEISGSEPETDGRQEEDNRHRWWPIAFTVFAIAILGLFITALLNSNPDQTDKQPGPPQGLAPAVSLYSTQRRSRTEPCRRLPDPSRRDGPSRPTTCPGAAVRA